MSENPGFAKFFSIKAKLEEASIWHSVNSHRDGHLCMDVVGPGQRWEIEVNSDGCVEVGVFKSDGRIRGEEMLDELFRVFSD